MDFGAQHRTERTQAPRRFGVGLVSSVDVLTYVASLMSLSFATHQIWLIWSTQNASGLSIVMWAAFTIAHVIWTLYGYVHNEKLIMTVHGVWIFFCVVILAGIVAFA